jgi:carbamoyl-phosphate synthase small subunit
MRAIAVAGEASVDEAVRTAKEQPAMAGRSLAAAVSTTAPYVFSDRGRSRIAVVDYGCKRSILDRLAVAGAAVTVFPHGAAVRDLLGFDGILLSNGPGDPEPLYEEVETIRALLGRVPILGICLGHQLLALATGHETYKLPFGHRGANHPVKDLETGRIEITSQNHGFAVVGPGGARRVDADEPVRWETDFGAAQLSHVNLYDRTVEGLTLLDVPGATVQYHPEAGPGPHDSLYLFDRFLDQIRAAA